MLQETVRKRTFNTFTLPALFSFILSSSHTCSCSSSSCSGLQLTRPPKRTRCPPSLPMCPCCHQLGVGLPNALYSPSSPFLGCSVLAAILVHPVFLKASPAHGGASSLPLPLLLHRHSCCLAEQGEEGASRHMIGSFGAQRGRTTPAGADGSPVCRRTCCAQDAGSRGGQTVHPALS